MQQIPATAAALPTATTTTVGVTSTTVTKTTSVIQTPLLSTGVADLTFNSDNTSPSPAYSPLTRNATSAPQDAATPEVTAGISSSFGKVRVSNKRGGSFSAIDTQTYCGNPTSYD